MRENERTLLPLFPLPIVLVPGELMPLHVFEERYKALMQEALDGERSFGLSYVARAEVGVDTPPAEGSVGCEARITAVAPLEDGRMNLLSVGTGRYRVRGYSRTEPFLVAEVERFADLIDESDDVAAMAGRVRQLFDRLAAAARTLSDQAGEQTPTELDVPPESLSFLVAANIPMETETKQRMLEITDTAARLSMLEERLTELVEANEYRASMHVRTKSNGHGRGIPTEQLEGE